MRRAIGLAALIAATLAPSALVAQAVTTGVVGRPAPTDGNQIAGRDAGGLLRVPLVDASGNLSFNCASGCAGGGGSAPAPLTAASTTAAGTVTTGGTYQSALAASTTRKGCLLIDTGTAPLAVFLGAPGSATAATSIPIAAGGSLNCATAGGIVLSDQISLTSATTGAAYLVISQ